MANQVCSWIHIQRVAIFVGAILLFFIFPQIASGQKLYPTKSAIQRSVESEALRNGMAYLFTKQAKDGGWHSEYYGALKSGAATTTLVLYALSHCENELSKERKAKARSAVNFLLPQIEKNGFVTNEEGPDYTVYSSAMLLIANQRLKLNLSNGIQTKLAEFLCEAQLGEKHGYKPGDANFGGWDLLGWARSKRRTAGTNISVSAMAVEALSLYPNDANAANAVKKAIEWSKGCQNFGVTDADGGFFFHPRKNHDGNKAKWTDKEKRIRPVSYGTATCDGLRLLIAARDVFENDQSAKGDALKGQLEERISAAQKWLRKKLLVEKSLDAKDGDAQIQSNDKTNLKANDKVTENASTPLLVPGFPESEQAQGWAGGLRFYFYFVLSKSLKNLVLDNEHKNEQLNLLHKEIVLQSILQSQKKNGFWENANSRMREDDPLIATSFCLISLSEFQKLRVKHEEK